MQMYVNLCSLEVRIVGHFHSHSHYVLILSQFFAMKAFVLRQDMLQVSQSSSFLTCFALGSIVTLGKGMLGGLVSPRVAYPFSYWILFGEAEPIQYHQ